MCWFLIILWRKFQIFRHCSSVLSVLPTSCYRTHPHTSWVSIYYVTISLRALILWVNSALLNVTYNKRLAVINLHLYDLTILRKLFCKLRISFLTNVHVHTTFGDRFISDYSWAMFISNPWIWLVLSWCSIGRCTMTVLALRKAEKVTSPVQLLHVKTSVDRFLCSQRHDTKQFDSYEGNSIMLGDFVSWMMKTASSQWNRHLRRLQIL